VASELPFARQGRQSFLFLQGPISVFSRLGDALTAQGRRVLHVNFCFGDWMLWQRLGAVNYRASASEWAAFIAALLVREQVRSIASLNSGSVRRASASLRWSTIGGYQRAVEARLDRPTADR
jgi:capsule polysaccharide modification protein KpsS